MSHKVIIWFDDKLCELWVSLDYFPPACREICFPAKHLKKFYKKGFAFEAKSSNPQKPSFAKLKLSDITQWPISCQQNGTVLIEFFKLHNQMLLLQSDFFVFFLRNSKMIYFWENIRPLKKRDASLVLFLLVWRYQWKSFTFFVEVWQQY